MSCEQRRERRPDDPVHAMGAERAARDVREREGGIEAEARERAVPPARVELGADGVAGDHDLPLREGGSRRGEGHRDLVREPADQPVREPGHDDLLVDEERPASRGGRHRGGDRDEPAGRDDHVGTEPPEERERAAEARRAPGASGPSRCATRADGGACRSGSRDTGCRPPAPTSPRCPIGSRSRRAGRRRPVGPGAPWRGPGLRPCGLRSRLQPGRPSRAAARGAPRRPGRER